MLKCLSIILLFTFSLQAIEASPITSGIVEPYYENTLIHAPISGVVSRVLVKTGEKVRKGQTLFQMDDRELRGQLSVIEANTALARVNLHQIEDKLKRIKSVRDPKLISKNELQARENEVDVAVANLKSLEAQIKQTHLMIDLLNVRSPQYGTVIQNDIQPGLYLQAGTGPAVALNDLNKLQVRVTLDEQNASHINTDQAATTEIKSQSIPLQFVRIEPQNQDAENPKTDILYSFDAPKDTPSLLGQHLEIHLPKK